MDAALAIGIYLLITGVEKVIRIAKLQRNEHPVAVTALAQLFFPKEAGEASYMIQAAISKVQP